MNKTYMLMCMSIALLAVLCVAQVSASVAPTKTVIAGKVYDSPNFETANGVNDANVNVTCGSTLKNATSLSDGTYTVYFDNLDNECPIGSTVTVKAEKNNIVSTTGTGIVHDYTSSIGVYLGIANVALVPEFGYLAGALTLVSAIAIFFVVRRK